MTTMGRIRTYYVVILMIFAGSSVLPTLSLPISAESAPAAGITLAVAAAEHHQSSLSFDVASASPRLTDSKRELSKHLHRNHEREQHHVNSGQRKQQPPPPTPAQIHDSATEDEATSGVEEQSQQLQQMTEEDQQHSQQQQRQQLQEHQTEQQIIDYSIYACDELPNLQQEDNSGANGKTSFDRCEFAMNCNGGDGILFSHFFFCNNDYKSSVSTSSSSSSHSLLLITLLALLLLLLSLLLLFRLLSSTTDEFFSPGLEMFSLRLGLPPRFAGVTLLALGNGAPDVAATMNAMLAGSRSVVSGGGGGEEEETGGREGYGMALGELTGTCMFNICLILGAIVIYLGGDGGSTDTRKNGDKKQRKDVAVTVVRGVPCQGPLLRDISVLILVCIVSMSYLKSGVIDHEFVYAMLGIYISYVLVVLGADAYHIFYHIPLLVDALRRSSSCDSGFSLNGPMPSDGEKGETGDGSITDEQTPLTALPSLRCDTSHRHLHHRNSSSSSLPPHHRHTIGETVIEAMSNYSCAEESILANHLINGGRAEHVQLIETAALSSLREEPAMIQMEASIGWAPILDDGNEPLVVFHPNHAVHPHHHHHHQNLRKPSDGPVLFLRSDSSTGSSPATRRPTLCVGDCRAAGAEETAVKATLSIEAPPLLTLTAIESGTSSGMADYLATSYQNHQIDSNRPNSWNEALSSNLQEFIEHWHNFFTGIYYNEEKSTWDIILLSIELPFTIARKVRSAVRSSLILTSLLLSHLCQIQLTNPVPCDGYYCRPLVAISLSLSPIWLWIYFSDQFDIDIFSYDIGSAVLITALGMGLVVLRYAPGGEGPMDLYMVVPLTLYGFAVAATWIDSIANKLVEILELFGILLRIPSTILGLTVLAFGNSLQDLVANVTLSKKGLSTMSTTACFAGPIFNLCAGLGLGFWALMKSTGRDEIHVELPRNIATGFMFAIANCILIIIAGVIGKGVIRKGYGYAACGMYSVYVLTSLYI